MKEDPKAKVEKVLGPTEEVPAGAADRLLTETFGAGSASKAVDKTLRFLKAADLVQPHVFRYSGNVFVDRPATDKEAAKKLSYWAMAGKDGCLYSLSESHQLQQIRIKKEVKPGDYVLLQYEGQTAGSPGKAGTNLWKTKLLAAENVPADKRF